MNLGCGYIRDLDTPGALVLDPSPECGYIRDVDTLGARVLDPSFFRDAGCALYLGLRDFSVVCGARQYQQHSHDSAELSHSLEFRDMVE